MAAAAQDASARSPTSQWAIQPVVTYSAVDRIRRLDALFDSVRCWSEPLSSVCAARVTQVDVRRPRPLVSSPYPTPITKQWPSRLWSIPQGAEGNDRKLLPPLASLAAILIGRWVGCLATPHLVPVEAPSPHPPPRPSPARIPATRRPRSFICYNDRLRRHLLQSLMLYAAIVYAASRVSWRGKSQGSMTRKERGLRWEVGWEYPG